VLLIQVQSTSAKSLWETPMKQFAIYAAITLSLGIPVYAHHSDAGIDMDSIIALDGTVTEFRLRNPHVYVAIEVVDSGGDAVLWELQMGTANRLTRSGWAPDTLLPGDKVAVRAHAAENGRPYAIIESIDKEGGMELDPATAPQSAPASTDSLTGVWTASASELSAYPGGYDGFFRAHLELTDEAIAAAAAYDPLSSDNPQSTCLGRATPAALVSSGLYLLEFKVNESEQTIEILSEYFDEERTIYMDGRQHPTSQERFITGHSIGHWEGEVLVIDTANFADHRSPYQLGVPSGAQKHVIERYQLIENGTRMAAEFFLEDPQYLAAPMTHNRELIYSPHLKRFQFNCDAEATRRFVND
jgi:hypothetical protein